MKNKVNIIGSGGHSRPVINLLELCGIGIEGIYDQSFRSEKSEEINSYLIRGLVHDVPKDSEVILAVGDNEQRETLYKEHLPSIRKENLVHPKAIIENRCVIGNSNQVFCSVIINSNVSIGDDNILNTGCIIEHETKIGSHNHISVGAILCGRVSIADRCFIGAGTVVIDKVSICSDVTVGANSVVVENISEPGTYVGCPARKIK